MRSTVIMLDVASTYSQLMPGLSKPVIVKCVICPRSSQYKMSMLNLIWQSLSSTKAVLMSRVIELEKNSSPALSTIERNALQSLNKGSAIYRAGAPLLFNSILSNRVIYH